MPTAVPITFPKQASSRNSGPATAASPTDLLAQSSVSPSTRWPGSPMSYKLMGSLGNRFYPGSSPGPFSGPLDLNDFKVHGGIASSIESEHGRLLKALNGDENIGKDDFCQNYACCGLDLQDLHALLEHFEEAHVVVLDSPSIGPTRFAQLPQSALDPDAMELDADSCPSSSASSPPSTPPMDSASAFDFSVLRSSSRMPTSAYTSPSHSRQHSPHPDSRNDAFNQYASYSRFSSFMPGAAETPTESHQLPNAKCIPPALLFSSSAQTTPTGSPAGSRISSPAPHKTHGNASAPARKSSQSAASSTAKDAGGASTTLSRPATTLMLSKPFRCPTVGCNKSYKQANGLKYHITHGQCNFMPRDPSLDGLDDHEADQKSRPYVCQVGSCTRRYKNMNGLRYHYQHSGAHGAVGLALLASGQHSLQTGNKDAGVDLPAEHYQQQAQQYQQQQYQQHQASEPHLHLQSTHPHFQHHLLVHSPLPKSTSHSPSPVSPYGRQPESSPMQV